MMKSKIKKQPRGLLNEWISSTILQVSDETSDDDCMDNESDPYIARQLKNYNIKATGSAPSIILWGKKANLDAEQQMAYEIITATFVLDYVEEANIRNSEVIDKLKQLARRNKNPDRPMVLFITGPAGAGKCK